MMPDMNGIELLRAALAIDATLVGIIMTGEGTIGKARKEAKKESLDAEVWNSVEAVAPKVKQWRYQETLGYVRTIDSNRVKLSPKVPPPD